MKKILLFAGLMILGSALWAQSEPKEEAIREAVEELNQLYQLTDQQQDEMYRIQARRFRNLAEIEALRDEDYKLYLAKLKSIRTGTENSIERLLTEDQRKIFYQQKAERRRQESAIIKEMRAAGATKEEIQLRLLEMEE